MTRSSCSKLDFAKEPLRKSLRLSLFNNNATVKFFWAAVLLSVRDVIYDLWLSEYIPGLQYSLITVCTIVVVAIIVLAREQNNPFNAIRKMKSKSWMRLFIVGCVSAYAYSYFWVIEKIGAGLFNMIDFGFTPVLTFIAGVLFFKERPKHMAVLQMVLFFIGFFLIVNSHVEVDISVLFLALTFPVATVIFFTVSKNLFLQENIEIDFVIFYRFAFALPFVALGFAYSEFMNAGLAHYCAAVISSIVFGYFPIRLILEGLKNGDMTKLAQSQVLIPLLSVLLTLYWYIDVYRNVYYIAGIVLFFVSLIVPFLALFRGGDENAGQRSSAE